MSKSRALRREPVRTETLRNVLQLLLEWGLVELLANGKLPIDTLLRDVEILDIEETIFADGLDEVLSEFLLSLWRTVKAEIDSYKVCPVKILL